MAVSVSDINNIQTPLANQSRALESNLLTKLDSTPKPKFPFSGVDNVKDITGGSVELKGYTTDYITPTLIELEIWSGEIAGKQIANRVSRTLKSQVKKKYKSRNDGGWAPNAENWARTKRKYYKIRRPMHLHDHRPEEAYVPGHFLAKTVRGFGNRISVVPAGNDTYVIRGLDEEFEFNPYVWFHETGTSRYPARPFITPAMQEAVEDGIRLSSVRHPITRLKQGSIKPMKYSMGDETFQLQVQKASMKSEEEMMMWMWWFMPQVEELRYLGIAHDMAGYMSGHFTDTSTLTNFAQSLAMGKAGELSGIPVSPKLARRSSRKAIWGSQSVSIVRGA